MAINTLVDLINWLGKPQVFFLKFTDLKMAQYCLLGYVDQILDHFDMFSSTQPTGLRCKVRDASAVYDITRQFGDCLATVKGAASARETLHKVGFKHASIHLPVLSRCPPHYDGPPNFCPEQRDRMHDAVPAVG